MVRLDRRHVILALPAQSQGLASALDMARDELDEAAWAVTPSGALHRGAGAIAAAVDWLALGRPGLSLAIYRLPVVGLASDLGYRLVVANRHRLPGTPVLADGRAEPPSEELLSDIASRRAERGAK